jgi:hypothetical protein
MGACCMRVYVFLLVSGWGRVRVWVYCMHLRQHNRCCCVLLHPGMVQSGVCNGAVFKRHKANPLQLDCMRFCVV